MTNRWGNNRNSDRLYFGELQNHCSCDCSHETKRRLLLGRKAMDNLDSILKKQRHYFANEGLSSQSYGFSSSHVWMLELDYKESWAPKNWCFWTVMLEMSLTSPLDCKESQPVHPKENQSWIFIGRTGAEAGTPILGHLTLEKIEGRKTREQQRMRQLDGITNLMDMSLSKLLELVTDREAWHAADHRVKKNQTGLSDWTERNISRESLDSREVHTHAYVFGCSLTSKNTYLFAPVLTNKVLTFS